MNERQGAFEAYKEEFKEDTGANWNDDLGVYIQYLQWKTQEAQYNQLVRLNETLIEKEKRERRTPK